MPHTTLNAFHGLAHFNLCEMSNKLGGIIMIIISSMRKQRYRRVTHPVSHSNFLHFK